MMKYLKKSPKLNTNQFNPIHYLVLFTFWFLVPIANNQE